MHTSSGRFSNVMCIRDDDPALPQSEKPNRNFPYGVNRFLITGLSAGESVTLTLQFPEAIPTTVRYFKVNSRGLWTEIVFGSNDGDNRITLTLADGDPLTNADGTIEDPGAITTTTPGASAADDSGTNSSA